MKQNFLLAGIFCGLMVFQTSIYTVSIRSVNNVQVSMNTYQGKKIIVAVFNPAAPDIVLLHALDSLAMADNTVKVIAVPAKELGAVNNTSLVTLSQSFSSGFLMMKPGLVKKNAAANQDVLFKWLTNLPDNGHFDNDVMAAGQLFIVSKTGVLYSVLGAGTEMATVRQTVNQNMQ